MCCFYFPFLKGVEFNEQLIKELKQKGNKIILGSQHPFSLNFYLLLI